MTISHSPLQSSDIEVLRTVIDESCLRFEIPKSGEDAAALATILIKQVQKVRRDRATLRAIATNLLNDNL